MNNARPNKPPWHNRSWMIEAFFLAKHTIIPGFLVFYATVVSQAQEYLVSGAFQYDLTRPNGEHYIRRRQFNVQVKEHTWKISTIDLENTNDWVYIHRHDGKQLYFFRSTHDSSANKMSEFAEDGSVPRNWSGAGVIYPWLAYASGHYFEGLTNDRAVSLRGGVTRDGVVQRYTVPCRWQLSDRPPSVPIQVQYIRTDRPEDNGGAPTAPLRIGRFRNRNQY